MMTNDDERGEGGKKCPKFDDVIICERPLTTSECNNSYFIHTSLNTMYGPSQGH